ncbi:MAG TPA: 50S ribosomal protein L15 [Nanoarchaeota archaeon]|nr:50S ribosomal protein L15 [Nanoarchaeota archaeon]
MSVNKRKKNSRYRGSKTHGCGSMKKRRGAGNKGGTGMAGSGKRAQSKKPTILKLYGNEYFGKHGFNRVATQHFKTINIAFLEAKFEELLAKGTIKNEKGMFEVDIEALGADKLLGTGNPTRKYRVKAIFASGSAAEKITEAGGEVIAESASEEKEEAEEEKQ